MVRRYVNSSTAYNNIFGDKNNLNLAYLYGCDCGKNAYNVKTDEGGTIATVTSIGFAGRLESGGSVQTGTYAANEALGASGWDAGHYMLNVRHISRSKT